MLSKRLQRAMRRAAEPPIGDERDIFAKTSPNKRTTWCQHLAHARAANRAFIPVERIGLNVKKVIVLNAGLKARQK
jgi:hypothetical protein